MGYQRRNIIPSGVDYKTIGFWIIYPLSITFSFHGLLLAYANSNYIEQHIGIGAIAVIYSIGAGLSILAFLFFSRLLRAFGNVKLVLALSLIDIATLITIGVTEHNTVMAVAFVLLFTVRPLIFLSIDIFSESLMGGDESSTGSRRGLTLSLMSIATVVAPMVMSLIVNYSGDDNLSIVYLTSAVAFVPFIIMVLVKLRHFQDPPYKKNRPIERIQKIWRAPDIRNVLLARLSLQLFFAWMIIYIPLYLLNEIGFSLATVGSIISVGLLAYVICEWPIGVLADKKWGEKEMMILGFLIIIISLVLISFIGANVLTWMIVFFFSRVGASLVASTTESYFFKHMKGGNADTIGFFRLSGPLSRLIGSLLGGLSLIYLPFNFIFIVLGITMIPAIFFAQALKDTK